MGARPQFIKLAPLSLKLKGVHEEIIIHTGQHYDYLMSEKIFLELEIRKPNIHLEIGSGSHANQTAEMMIAMEAVMILQKPNLVIVFGDTNSTLAGALAASKLQIPILHIEAGLRAFIKNMPEEINRIVTDHVSKYLFAPTLTAVKNLSNEGLGAETSLTGDIMVDTMNCNIKITLQKSNILSDLNLHADEYNLLTIHCNCNVDNQLILENLLVQLGQLEDKIIFPVHPHTKKMLSATYHIPDNITVTEPLEYL